MKEQFNLAAEYDDPDTCLFDDSYLTQEENDQLKQSIPQLF